MFLRRENDRLRQRIVELEQQLQLLKDWAGQDADSSSQVHLLDQIQNDVDDTQREGINSSPEQANDPEQLSRLDIDGQDSEHLFRAYVETANDMVYTLDETGRFTFINPYGQKLLGYTEEEWSGRYYLEFVAPNDRSRVAEAFAALMKTGELKDFEFALQPKTGSEVYLQVNGRLLYRNRQLVGGLGIARDVTERKRFEQQLQIFRKAVEAAYDSAIITNLEGCIQYANPAAGRMFGYSLQDLQGDNISIFYPEEDENQVEWVVQRAIDGGWCGESICRRHSGERFPALVSVGAICDENGQPTAVSIICRDISDQKQIQAELASKNIELEQASRLKSEFLANMSHELRTPLTAILGFSSLLKQQIFGGLNAKQAVYITQIHQSGKHLLNLINEVLDISKVEAGQIVLEIEPINIPSLCEAALALLQEQARSRGISIQKSISENISPLLADELRVRQMLLNLLSNAIKFSHENGTIGLDVTAQDGYVNLVVWDEGIGIPADKQSLLFQPFQQLDSSLSRRHEGTGLGLALTRQLAELHGGTVDFQSEAGKGSRFTIRLPLQLNQRSYDNGDATKAEEQQDAAIASGDATKLAFPLLDSTKLDSSRVLVVEDNSPNALLLQDLLQHWGYEVHCARDGMQALDWLQAHSADLVLLDIQLPNIDGFEVTRQIRSNPNLCEIPVVATTALAMVGDRDRCLDAGMQDYISKPIDHEILAEKLTQYTGRRPQRSFF